MKTKTLTFKLPAGQAEAFRRKCLDIDISMSEFLCEKVEDFINNIDRITPDALIKLGESFYEIAREEDGLIDDIEIGEARQAAMKACKIMTSGETSTLITEKRKNEIANEAKRRLCVWLENDTIQNMTCQGSRMRFDMALGLLGGYPFEMPSWMHDRGFDGFVTEDEFNDPQYDEVIDDLYAEAMAQEI